MTDRGYTNRKELLWLGAAVLVSVAVHAFPIIRGFGEPDAARLAILAAEWHETGSMASYFYEVRTSPLYIHFIKLLLDSGYRMAHVPALLNWLNLITGALSLVPLYFIWRTVASRAAAIAGCVLVSFAPAFWLAGIYGMPHGPAYFVFVTALWLFALALRHESIPLYVAATVLGVLSVTTKADIILCFGAFLAVAWCMKRLNRTSLLLAVAIPVLAFIVTVIYARLITPSVSDLGTSMERWDQTFPFTLQSITDSANRAVLVNTSGRILTALIVISLVYCLVRLISLRAVSFALVWALPPILFWGLKMGNSARHMMSAFSALTFVAAIFLVTVFRRPLYRWIAIGVVLGANYLAGPVKGGTVSPPSRLFAIKESVRFFGNYRHAMGQVYAAFEIDRKLYAGSATNPYIIWEALVYADDFAVDSRSPLTYKLYNRKNTILFRVDEVAQGDTVGPSRDWFVFSFEPEIKTLNYPEFREYMRQLTAVADRAYARGYKRQEP